MMFDAPINAKEDSYCLRHKYAYWSKEGCVRCVVEAQYRYDLDGDRGRQGQDR